MPKIRVFSVPKASPKIGDQPVVVAALRLLPESSRKSIPQLVNVLASHRSLAAPGVWPLDLPNHQALAGGFHNVFGHLL